MRIPHRHSVMLLLATALLLASPLVRVQGQAAGPDVYVPEIPAVSNYGSVGTTAAFSIATTVCNSGSQPASWVGWTSLHPVIAQNLYRLKDDRL